MRVSAILFVVSLSLFANNGYCYFAAIFIIATAVTQLDFLQNLAAIIRGSKEYFDYKKENKSVKEVEDDIEKESKIVDEIIEEDKGEDPDLQNDDQSTKNNSVNSGKLGLLIEEFTFRYLEKKFVAPIEKYVRIRSKHGTVIEIDGIMRQNNLEAIFEIKSSTRKFYPSSVIKTAIVQSVSSVKLYNEITNKKASLRLIFVGDFDKAKTFLRINDLLKDYNAGILVSVDIYSFEDIGLNIEDYLYKIIE